MNHDACLIISLLPHTRVGEAFAISDHFIEKSPVDRGFFLPPLSIRATSVRRLFCLRTI